MNQGAWATSATALAPPSPRRDESRYTVLPMAPRAESSFGTLWDAMSLLLPGMMGSDSYLLLLAGWLRRIGYRPALLGGGPNVGSLPDLLQQVIRRTDALAEPGRRLTLVGHSLGGMRARLAAGARPECVDRVITLRCPVSGDHRAGNPIVVQLSRSLISGADDAFVARCRMPLPAGVQATSIYSRRDPVVAWHACIDPDPCATSIEAHGSHMGLTWNAAVYRRLATSLIT